jgi:hypothetical protein
MSERKKLTNHEALSICEGLEDSDEGRQIEAWQHLVDTGMAWTLPGAFGRMARRMIEEGVITEGESNAS